MLFLIKLDIEEDKVAYHNYNLTLRKLAKHYEVGFVQTVACFVALSPNNDYLGNLRSTVSVIKGIKRNSKVEDIKVSTYNACKNRAYQYFVGNKDFLVETKGPKTRNFYFNILKPEDPSFITIDGHMFGVWSGERLTMVEVAKRGFNYDKVANDFKKVAKKNKLLPNQLQAILWFTQKRIHNVIFNPQLSLINQNNHWNTLIEPQDIKEFV